MSLVEEDARDQSLPVGVVDGPEGLSAIREPGCSAAIWQRDPLPAFQSWIDTLPPEKLPEGRLLLRPKDVREAVLQTCQMRGTPDCAERAMLVDDIAALAELFCALMKVPYLRLRLDVVTTNMCPKFHVDAVTARLICTYRGTGTQYGVFPDTAEPQPIFTAPTGAPIMLRGTLWPEEARSRFLHRSPPIAGTGETRLVLVLDPVADPQNDPVWRALH